VKFRRGSNAPAWTLPLEGVTEPVVVRLFPERWVVCPLYLSQDQREEAVRLVKESVCAALRAW